MTALNAKAIYGALRKLVPTWATARGFQLEGNGAGWAKRLSTEHTFALRFQCDKNGFSELTGNQFTLNLLVVANDDGETCLLHNRYGAMLDDHDRSAMAEIHRRIMARRAHHDEEELDASSTDPWLRAYDDQDIRSWWTELLEPRLDRICARFLETGGARPTPVTRTVSVPSLDLGEHPDHATLSLSNDDAPILARELRTLSTESPMFSIVMPTAHFIFERRERFRSGTGRVEALGIAKHRRVWIELGPKALDELADVLVRAQPATVTLLESSHLELEIRTA